MTERQRVREIDDDEGRRLVRIVRRGSGPVVTWRGAQMVLLSAQAMDAAAAKLNGLMLIVTHAADPCQLTPDTLMDVFASPVTLVGWAPL